MEHKPACRQAGYTEVTDEKRLPVLSNGFFYYAKQHKSVKICIIRVSIPHIF